MKSPPPPPPGPDCQMRFVLWVAVSFPGASRLACLKLAPP